MAWLKNTSPLNKSSSPILHYKKGSIGDESNKINKLAMARVLGSFWDSLGTWNVLQPYSINKYGKGGIK